MDSKSEWEKVKQQMETSPLSLGYKTSYTVRNSAHGLLFILARYKFAVKMMANRKGLKVLDLGCNDGLGDLMIWQDCDCENVTGVDFDDEAIGWANSNIACEGLEFICQDFMGVDVYPQGGDFVVSLDVIEHIPVEQEDAYFQTVCKNLKREGVAIIGTPNVTMYPYASPWNKAAHINNYDQKRLYDSMHKYFENVFIFGMNDEVLHTGMYPMVSYIMAMGCGNKKG